MGGPWVRARRLVGLLAVSALVSSLVFSLPGRSMDKGLAAADGAMRDLGWPVDELHLRQCSYQKGLVSPARLEATYAHAEKEGPWAIGLTFSPLGGWSVERAAAPRRR